MLIQTRSNGFSNKTAVANRLRGVFKSANLDGFIYEPSFLLVDQQESTLHNMLQNVGIAVVVMLLIAVLFIPKLLSALWIGLSILSINVGVIGGLALWNVRLDIVSMITIVMAIGFSVDFVAHITYHFLVSRGKDRLHRALKYVGTPILQSGLSTILGVASLIPADSYMVRTFVKTVVLVVGLGIIHGLIFLPVLLSICVPNDQYLEVLSMYKSRVGHYLATNIPKYLTQRIKNKRMRAYFNPVEEPATSDESLAEIQDNAPIRKPPQQEHHTTPSHTTPQHMQQHQLKRKNLKIPSREAGRERRRAEPEERHEIVNASDLYDFLKFKSNQMLSSVESDDGEEIYSEVCDRSCNSCSSTGCQTHNPSTEYILQWSCRRHKSSRPSLHRGLSNRDDRLPSSRQSHLSKNRHSTADPDLASYFGARDGAGRCSKSGADTWLNDGSIHNFRKNASVFAHQFPQQLHKGAPSRLSLHSCSSGAEMPFSQYTLLPTGRLSGRFKSSRQSNRMHLKRNEIPRQSLAAPRCPSLAAPRCPSLAAPKCPSRFPPPPRETQRLGRPLVAAPRGETVEIVLNGQPNAGRGRMSRFQRSISAEHLQSMESLADSDLFGAFQRSSSGRKFAKTHISGAGSVPDFSTFKGAACSAPPANDFSDFSADEDSEEQMLY